MNNKLKICHVISGYYRNDPRVFQRQCKSLQSFGFEVCLLTNDGGPEEFIDGIKVHVCEKYWSNRLKVLLFAKSQFINEALKLGAVIYQLHSPELISLGKELKKNGKIVIYDAHEDLPRHILEKNWLPKPIRNPLSKLVNFYIKRVLSYYDAIITPHQHVVDDLKQINNSTILITNFAKVLSKFSVSKEDYFKRENIVCYSGTVYRHSNQLTILDAINNIDNIKYSIAGYISPDYDAAISSHNAYKKINFVGRLPWEQLRNFYLSARIGLVIIDYKMNLGGKRGTFAVNKMFEYMEAGLPFICTDYELWKEVVEKYECGICVEPGNMEQIRNAITFLLDNPNIAYQMGQNGRNAVLEKYNWGTQEIKYLEIFRRLIV